MRCNIGAWQMLMQLPLVPALHVHDVYDPS